MKKLTLILLAALLAMTLIACDKTPGGTSDTTDGTPTQTDANGQPALAAVLRDVLATPVSPELLPAKDGEIAQKTENVLGAYELHDFFLYHILHNAYRPAKVLWLAEKAFAGEYDRETLLKWLKNIKMKKV